MILAIDTSTPVCTAALIGADGHLHSSRDDRIGRGHAEHLMPMIRAMLDGFVPAQILVGVGPGSFTGLRIGIAAAHGLSIGWDVPLHGMNSLALVAAGEQSDEPLAVAMSGGHGELFVQDFPRGAFARPDDVLNLPPDAAARVIATTRVVGDGARALVDARGHGEAVDRLPSASNALKIRRSERTLPPTPVYARAPDAKPRAA